MEFVCVPVGEKSLFKFGENLIKKKKKVGGERDPEMLSTETTAVHEQYATNSGENFPIRTQRITHNC